MIKDILKKRLHLSDEQIEVLDTLIYFKGYVIDEEMNMTDGSVYLTSKYEETKNDSIVRISYEPITKTILVRTRSFVYGTYEEAISDSKLVMKDDKIDLAMEYSAKGKVIRGSMVNGIYSYYSDNLVDSENIKESTNNDVVVATLLGKVKFLATAKMELPLDKDYEEKELTFRG